MEHTDSFQAHKDDNSWAERVVCAFPACEQIVLHICVL